jgi:hypothetical protein
MENSYASAVKQGLKDYDAQITPEMVRLGKTSYKSNVNSYIISVRHPNNPAAVLVLLSTDSKEASQGLARKLPHYAKYSYAAFGGAELTNLAKGVWPVAGSPLGIAVKQEGGDTVEVPRGKLAIRESLSR